MLKLLGITPQEYYDLTNTETAALLAGANERKVEHLRGVRVIATLLRNAHFKGSVSPTQFMPLPGDGDFMPASSSLSNKSAFNALVSALGGFASDIIIEPNEP